MHGFLEEIGQGVQHIASRVDNIISFVQEANDRRKIFGEVSSQLLMAIDASLLIPHISAQSSALSFYFLGLYIPKYSSQLLWCLDKGDAEERY